MSIINSIIEMEVSSSSQVDDHIREHNHMLIKVLMGNTDLDQICTIMTIGMINFSVILLLGRDQLIDSSITIVTEAGKGIAQIENIEIADGINLIKAHLAICCRATTDANMVIEMITAHTEVGMVAMHIVETGIIVGTGMVIHHIKVPIEAMSQTICMDFTPCRGHYNNYHNRSQSTLCEYSSHHINDSPIAPIFSHISSFVTNDGVTFESKRPQYQGFQDA